MHHGIERQEWTTIKITWFTRYRKVASALWKLNKLIQKIMFL